MYSGVSKCLVAKEGQPDTFLGEGCGISLLHSLSESFQTSSLSLVLLLSSLKLNFKHLMP